MKAWASWRSLLCAVGLVLMAARPDGACALELNKANQAQLEQLDGLGVAMAERILAERAKAPFRDWEDLARRVKGMRGARSEQLQRQGVTVNGVAGPVSTTHAAKR
ncbi:MAG: DUF655 domain-containing protein [Sutterellaceae bacterium]|nr:DUF655 domain-containing protein [Burkholderiaceae bacterium]MCX7900837.1 DUF655 domain-containing protein [Burkholderiaceae bacterium]MDW8430815.1 DUF655 domain-containing protein [Sutterellaceae bacterium]